MWSIRASQASTGRRREWSQRHERRQQFTERNINCIAKYVDDDELRLVQNRHGVHLCPSEAEGFGHTLVEAMSCGAVVITTDGPPMNEMVTPDRGALVRYGRTGRQRLGTNYFVDVDALEKSIVSVMAMPEAEKRALGASARRWYQSNGEFFRQRVVELVGSVQSSACGPSQQ